MPAACSDALCEWDGERSGASCGVCGGACGPSHASMHASMHASIRPAWSGAAVECVKRTTSGAGGSGAWCMPHGDWSGGSQLAVFVDYSSE